MAYGFSYGGGPIYFQSYSWGILLVSPFIPWDSLCSSLEDCFCCEEESLATSISYSWLARLAFSLSFCSIFFNSDSFLIGFIYSAGAGFISLGGGGETIFLGGGEGSGCWASSSKLSSSKKCNEDYLQSSGISSMLAIIFYFILL